MQSSKTDPQDNPTPTPTRRGGTIALAIIVLAYLAWTLIYLHPYVCKIGETNIPCLFDDAMISMRYAENIANGNGPVWNIGERVEGYTNPLMVAVMAGLIAMSNKIIALHLVQWFGLATILITAWAAHRSQQQLLAEANKQTTCAIITFGAVLANYALSYWGLFGMETGLSAALLAITFLIVTRPNLTTTRKAIAAAILLPLLYFTRPDHILYAGPILLYGAWPQIKKRKMPTAWILAGITTVAVITTHLLWRHSYYGEWQPNTALLKLGGFPLGLRLQNGLLYIAPYLPLLAPMFALAAIGVRTNPSAEKFLAVTFAPIAIAYQIYVGGDAFERIRIITPTIPLLTIPVVSGAIVIIDRIRILNHRNPAARTWATAALTIAAVLTANGTYTQEQFLLSRFPSLSYNQANIKTGLLLRMTTHQNAKIAVFWAGALPYFAERHTYDLLGKCDPKIAKQPPHKTSDLPRLITHPGHNKYDLNYSIVGLKPDYIQGLNWGNHERVDLEWANQYYRQFAPLGQPVILNIKSSLIDWNTIDALCRPTK